jgi:RimJ/RimL family protein N-acetyltransferase
MKQEPASAGTVVLETERLLLRRWRISDAALQRELWTERDARVPPHRRIDADGHPTVEDLEDHIRGPEPDASLGLLAAERRDSGDVIGYCGLIPNVHGQDDEPELAYEFLRRIWGHGYATEAARAVKCILTARGGIQPARCIPSSITSTTICRRRSRGGHASSRRHGWPAARKSIGPDQSFYDRFSYESQGESSVESAPT